MRGSKVGIALLVAFINFGVTAQVSRAQWIDARKTDAYPSFSKRMQALSAALDVLEKANPALDLRKAVRKGDFRFVGYNEFTYIIPGVPDQAIDFAGKHLKVLKGSSDVLTGPLSQRITRLKRTYMKPYNMALLNTLVKKRPRKK